MRRGSFSHPWAPPDHWRGRFSMWFWPAWGIAMGVVVGSWNLPAGLVLAALGILAGVASWRRW